MNNISKVTQSIRSRYSLCKRELQPSSLRKDTRYCERGTKEWYNKTDKPTCKLSLQKRSLATKARNSYSRDNKLSTILSKRWWEMTRFATAPPSDNILKKRVEPKRNNCSRAILTHSLIQLQLLLLHSRNHRNSHDHSHSINQRRKRSRHSSESILLTYMQVLFDDVVQYSEVVPTCNFTP